MIVNDLALLEALPGKLAALASMRAEVGVLEDSAPRVRATTAKERNAASAYLQPWEIADTTASDETNASIGFRHEMGSASGKLPRRSFLKDPLLIAGQEAVSEGGVGEALSEYLFGEAAKDEVMEKLATSAEAAIDGAFETGGYGTWAPLSAFTKERKMLNHDQILVETEQLRGSITHRITSARA